jgi:hypothetical protein
MKTKAEKYAEGYRCPATNENEYCKHDIISAFNTGYNQCQEDMADMKYTIKEVERYHDIRATQGIKNANNYINSLNKQE